MLIPVLGMLIFGSLMGCASQNYEAVSPLTTQIAHTHRPLLATIAEPAPVRSTNDDADMDKDADDPLWDDELDDFDDLEENNDIYTVADPLEPFNRAMFHINDKMYFWLFKPLASGYKAIAPSPIRLGIRNFFNNLKAPIRIANNILQGNGEAAEAEWAKFVYNSTVGVLGFGNPAKNHPALNPDSEDFGQTLARYGIGDGFFIYWPILGPTTLRDTVGDVTDGFYLNPIGYIDSFETYLVVRSVDTFNELSFYLDDYETIKKAALDPYISIRDGYVQLRQSKIKK
jgi:phospholipid-binding lipoprotein MlaA